MKEMSTIIMPTFFGYLFCVFLAYMILWRKKRKKNVRILQWVVASFTTLFYLYARINYVKNYDWEYAAVGIHISASALVSIISLQYFYNKNLYRFFFAVFCLHFIIFYGLLFTVGGYPVHTYGHLNGSVFHGVNALVHAYFAVMMSIVAWLSYKTIPIVEDFDAMSSKQLQVIEQQTIQQREMAADVRLKMTELFPQIEQQENVAVDFQEKMQAQAASFEEISATLEELLGNSENIFITAEKQVDESNKTEDMINDFKEIKSKTKIKLNSTLEGIKTIVNESEKGKEKLSVVEKTINEIMTQSDSINDMIGIITDIADKINLLSLNASIEAARAGEHGRGFAVVADEIGKLANQTTDSIKQIETMLIQSTNTTSSGVQIIKDTSDIIRHMIESMINSSERIGDLQNSIITEEEYIEQIYSQMKQNIELANHTEVGMSEQKLALESTTKVIEHLNTLVEELVSGVEVLTSSSEKIADNAKILLDKTELAALK